MPQFFVRPEDVRDGRCFIRGADFLHLSRVRRVSEGDEMDLRLPDGSPVRARITGVGDDFLCAEIIDKKRHGNVHLNLSLYAAVLKGHAFDTVIRKAVEIGVTRIIPVITERTVPDIGLKELKRLDRWNRIASEAAKQCMRDSLPAVGPVTGFNDAVRSASGRLRLIAHPGEESGRSPFSGAGGRVDEVSVLVGPEGGFSPGEIESARANGWRMFSFGFTQLRAETAAVIVPAILVYAWSMADENNG